MWTEGRRQNSREVALRLTVYSRKLDYEDISYAAREYGLRTAGTDEPTCSVISKECQNRLRSLHLRAAPTDIDTLSADAIFIVSVRAGMVSRGGGQSAPPPRA